MEKPASQSFLSIQDLAYVFSALQQPVCTLDNLQLRADALKASEDVVDNCVGDLIHRFVELNKKSMRPSK